MAKVLGVSGRYVSDQVVAKFHSLVTTVIITIVILATLGGISIGLAIRNTGLSPWLVLMINGTVVLAICIIWKRVNPRLDALLRERENMRRGANGESAVAETLKGLPESYHVINDIGTQSGNLDHVVIGPTGVFIIDAKDWRGVVSAAGNGELLCNGEPTSKPEIRRFTRRIMAVREKLQPLPSNLFFQPVFVFTSARVEAKWKTTQHVHCMCEDQLVSYILKEGFRQKLTSVEIQELAQAFEAFAHTDMDFGAWACQAPSDNSLQTV